jgi:hypothetical protein
MLSLVQLGSSQAAQTFHGFSLIVSNIQFNMDEDRHNLKPEAEVTVYQSDNMPSDESIQDQKHSAIAFQSESAATDELLQDQKPSRAEQGSSPQQARYLMSRSTITRVLIDFTMLIVPIYFLLFGLLVYSAREQPADQVLNGQLAARLSEIAKVVSYLA